MPIIIADNLPAARILEEENIGVLTKEKAVHQDIRPLEIVILNLMPNKIITETQLLRLLGNSPLQINIRLMQAATHVSKNTSAEHLLEFYHTFDQLKDGRYDGLIITGAPVETLPFEEVDYWPELERIMDWSEEHVFSSYHICWGAQAGLYHHYGIGKRLLPQKLSGIYLHRPCVSRHPLLLGFDEEFFMPHSRYTALDEKALSQASELRILVDSEAAGPVVIASDDTRRVFVTGHSEYDADTLADEYARDMGRGLRPAVPCNYFPGDDTTAAPLLRWRSHANLLMTNWLNVVYQQTPYEWTTTSAAHRID